MSTLCERLMGEMDCRIMMVSHTPKDLSHLHIIRDALPNGLKPLCMIPDTRSWRGPALKKLISAPNVGGSESSADDRAKSAGFHKLKKVSTGEYEKLY